MEILGLFDGESPLSVATIQSKLKKSGHDLAYTTVMTVLVRLHQKGHLSRKKEGRQFLYSQAKEGGRVRDKILSKVQSTLFRGERLKPILALLDGDEELTRAELEELRNRVNTKLKEAGK